MSARVDGESPPEERAFNKERVMMHHSHHTDCSVTDKFPSLLTANQVVIPSHLLFLFTFRSKKAASISEIRRNKMSDALKISARSVCVTPDDVLLARSGSDDIGRGTTIRSSAPRPRRRYPDLAARDLPAYIVAAFTSRSGRIPAISRCGALSSKETTCRLTPARPARSYAVRADFNWICRLSGRLVDVTIDRQQSGGRSSLRAFAR